MGAEKIIFIVAPGGAVGGGMGRVKDYILQSGGDRAGRYRFEAWVTRDERGAFHSLLLLAKAMLAVFLARIGGNLAFVHVNFGDKGSAFRKGLLILFAKAIGARVLLHLHAAELTEFYASSPGWRRAALRWPFEAADCVVVLGRLWRDWLVQELGLPAGKIDILYNGVPADPAPRRFAAGESGPRRILFLGFLTERKGISDFLAALAPMPRPGRRLSQETARWSSTVPAPRLWGSPGGRAFSAG